MTTAAQENECHLNGCIRDQPGHQDHTWTDGVHVRRVGMTTGVVYVYALADDDRTEFPDDEILIGLYEGDMAGEPDGEATMTVEQAEQLHAALHTAIEFTRLRASAGGER